MVARPPTILTATSWDLLARGLLAEGAAGSVHSVFERAFNVVMRGSELVGIVGPAAGNGPATVVLATLPGTSFTRLGIEPGTLVTVADGRLTSLSERLVIELGAARAWRLMLTGLAVSRSEAEQRIRRAAEMAGRVAPTGGLGALLPAIAAPIAQTAATSDPGRPSSPDLLSRARGALRALIAGVADRDEDAIRAAAGALCGLGPGLTPSGDDALAGFMVGLARARGRIDARLGEIIAETVQGRTTDIAVARVRHAADGQIEEAQEAVARVILGRDGSSLEDAVARAAAWGHTSGADTLVGLLLGLGVGLAHEQLSLGIAGLPSTGAATARPGLG